MTKSAGKEGIMLRSVRVIGFEMNRQKNRRVLVLVTYAAVIVVTVVFSLATVYRPGIWLDLLTGGMWFFITVVAYFVFGRIASPFLMVPLSGHPPQRVQRGLGLSATVPPEEPPADERDIAVRNSAYYTAYHIFIGLCIAVFLALPLYENTPSEFHKPMRFTAVILLSVLAFTLPQAVVLWREKDITFP